MSVKRFISIDMPKPLHLDLNEAKGSLQSLYNNITASLEAGTFGHKFWLEYVQSVFQHSHVQLLRELKYEMPTFLDEFRIIAGNAFHKDISPDPEVVAQCLRKYGNNGLALIVHPSPISYKADLFSDEQSHRGIPRIVIDEAREESPNPISTARASIVAQPNGLRLSSAPPRINSPHPSDEDNSSKDAHLMDLNTTRTDLTNGCLGDDQVHPASDSSDTFGDEEADEGSHRGAVAADTTKGKGRVGRTGTAPSTRSEGKAKAKATTSNETDDDNNPPCLRCEQGSLRCLKNRSAAGKACYPCSKSKVGCSLKEARPPWAAAFMDEVKAIVNEGLTLQMEAVMAMTERQTHLLQLMMDLERNSSAARPRSASSATPTIGHAPFASHLAIPADPSTGVVPPPTGQPQTAHSTAYLNRPSSPLALGIQTRFASPTIPHPLLPSARPSHQQTSSLSAIPLFNKDGRNLNVSSEASQNSELGDILLVQGMKVPSPRVIPTPLATNEVLRPTDGFHAAVPERSPLLQAYHADVFARPSSSQSVRSGLSAEPEEGEETQEGMPEGPRRNKRRCNNAKSTQAAKRARP